MSRKQFEHQHRRRRHQLLNVNPGVRRTCRQLNQRRGTTVHHRVANPVNHRGATASSSHVVSTNRLGDVSISEIHHLRHRHRKRLRHPSTSLVGQWSTGHVLVLVSEIDGPTVSHVDSMGVIVPSTHLVNVTAH